MAICWKGLFAVQIMIALHSKMHPMDIVGLPSLSNLFISQHRMSQALSQ